MKQFLDTLREEYEKKNTLLCFGMDPVIERMRIDPTGRIDVEIYNYFSGILDVISGKISAVKPNLGFYLQYGQQGLTALTRLIRFSHGLELPVIVDGKIGDIGATSEAYARFVFELLHGDGLTLSPYLGYDSLAPFFSYTDKGFYVLALTSNRGARDFQYTSLDTGIPLYEKVIQEICAWNKSHRSVGAVVGATHLEFGDCVGMIKSLGFSIPLLVPGVGAQGGSYQKTLHALHASGYDPSIVRINASSSISYAHERYPEHGVEEAALRAVEDILKK